MLKQFIITQVNATPILKQFSIFVYVFYKEKNYRAPYFQILLCLSNPKSKIFMNTKHFTSQEPLLPWNPLIKTEISVNDIGARSLLKDTSGCEFSFLFLDDICENATFTIVTLPLMISKDGIIYLCMVKTWHLLCHTCSCCHLLCHTYSYKWRVVSE